MIIKYAGFSEQAFVFEMDNKNEENADQYFDLLIASRQLNHIDYFKELAFCHFLADRFGGMSIDDLRNISGMNESRILTLMKNKEGISCLLEYGVAPDQVLSINLEKMEQFGREYYHADKALKFITINQALGIDHVPRPLNEINIPRENQWRSLGGSGSGSSGDFSYEHDNNSIKVRFEETKKFDLRFGELKDSVRIELDDQSSPISLVNQWHSLNNGTTWKRHFIRK